MKAISNELHAAIMNVMGQLPMAQVEQLVIGLRAAEDIPPPIAQQLQNMSKQRAIMTLTQQLAQLQAPPDQDKEGNGAADRPPAEA